MHRGKALSAAEAEGAETLPLGAACLDLPICAPGRPDRTSAAQRNSAQPVFGLDGTVDDSAVSDLALVGRQVVDFAVATRSRRLQEEMR